MGQTWSRAAGVACLALAFLASGADLTVEKLAASGNVYPPEGEKEIAVGNAPFTGDLTYFLPRTAINISLSVVAHECGSLSADPVPDANASADEKPANDKLSFKVNATAAPTLEADPNYRYAIDYHDAESWMKEINFTLNTTPNKVFQSFNGTINDQSGPIVLGALAAAVQIAGAVAIPATGAIKATEVAANVRDITTYSTKFVIRGSVKKRVRIAVHHKPKPPLDAKIYCTQAVQAALSAIMVDQQQIKILKDRITAYRKMISGATPGKSDPTTIWSNAIVALQSEVADKISAKLTRSIMVKWIPSGAQMEKYSDGDSTIYVGWTQVPISAMVTKFLSSGATGNDPDRDGMSWYTNSAHANPSDTKHFKVWYQAHTPYSIVIALDGPTYFDKNRYDTKIGKGSDPLEQYSPKGLVVRDPAIGFLQNCTVSKDTPPETLPPVTPGPDGLWGYGPDIGRPCQAPSFVFKDTSAGSDDSSRVALSMPQFGRALVFDAHSAMFENASLAITLNADGTISSVGTHDTSTAAAGLATLATTAQAAATAQAAHNTAVSAENTSIMNQMQIPDNTNKYYADCLTQAAAIVKAEGTAAPCVKPAP